MKHTKPLCVTAALTLFLPLTGVVGAGPKDEAKAREQYEIRAAMQRGEVQPLTQILVIATGKVPGDVIEVELEKKGEALIYEIKILTAEGTVREVKIDARTGVVTKIKDD